MKRLPKGAFTSTDLDRIWSRFGRNQSELVVFTLPGLYWDGTF